MSTESNPPSYVAAMDNELKKAAGNPEKQAASMDAMTEKLNSSEVKKTLAEEVRSLTGTAIEIDEAFEDIRGKLTKAELQATRDEWKGEVPLVDGWVKLQKEFRALLLRSRKSASDIVYYIDRFNNVVIDAMNDPNASKEDRQEVINDFINKKIPYNGPEPESGLRAQLDDAWNYATKFEDLAREVKLYSAKFLDVGASQKAIWMDRSKVLDDDINQLKLDLVAIHERIVKWAAVVGVGLGAAAGAGVLFALGPIGPIAAGVVAISGLVAAGVGSYYLDQALTERRTKEKEKKDKEDEWDEIKKKQAALAKVQLDMAEAVRKADGIVSRLLAFKVIWNQIANEGRKLLNHVDDTIKDSSNYVFKKDVKFAQEGFALLKVALNNYAELIDKSGIKNKPNSDN